MQCVHVLLCLSERFTFFSWSLQGLMRVPEPAGCRDSAVIVTSTDALPAVFYASLRSATSSSDVMMMPVGVLVLETSFSAHVSGHTRLAQ